MIRNKLRETWCRIKEHPKKNHTTIVTKNQIKNKYPNNKYLELEGFNFGLQIPGFNKPFVRFEIRRK
ncbi:hypothetical protein GIB67_014767, partial [Kingdonia uniflora]